MNIKLYSTQDAPIKVNKTLTLIADITGESRESVDCFNPSFILSAEILNQIKSANYLYCTDWGKFYFLNSKELKNKTVVASCREDVLMSLKEQLLSQTVTVSRNAKISNAYLLDNGYQMLSYSNIVTKEFPSGVDQDSVIFMTVG